MNFIRLDAFTMNFPDCSASKKYKLANGTGSGEKRIYVGKDEKKLDIFFDLQNISAFIIRKKDLEKYIDDSESEFSHPTQEYRNNISQYYDSNVKLIKNLTNENLVMGFTKKYDSQKRYYLVLKNDGFSNDNYNYFYNIALPKVTKLNFLKILNQDNGQKFILIQPVYFNNNVTIDDLYKVIDTKAQTALTFDEYKETRIKIRKGQAKYRDALLNKHKCCLVTGIDDERLLKACHIKPHSECSDMEKYDVNNGFVFSPTIHELFDLGMISFEDNGKLLISPFLSNENIQKIHLDSNKMYKIPNKSIVYLQYHRTNIFKSVPKDVLKSLSKSIVDTIKLN